MSLSITKIVIAVIVIGGLGFIIASNVGFINNKKASSNDSFVGQEIPKASLEQPKIKVGEIFPDFEVTEVDGTSITRDSLRDKPAIVWFTTSWCVPCQIGARDVSKLDNELGGEAFNVLVIFVDLSEKDSDLTNWRKSFANPDWMVAFDNNLTNLAKKAEIRFLDSKFLLDKNGLIKNIDFKQADNNYLDTIKQIVKENS